MPTYKPSTSAVTPGSFAAALLRGLGIHQTPGAVQGVVGWEGAEGGNWHNQAAHNPLNTTQPMPGAGNTGSQGNIKVYRDWQQGLQATIRTLRNGHYGPILQALQAGDPSRIAAAIGQTPWGTSGGLVAKTIASTPRVAGVQPFTSPTFKPSAAASGQPAPARKMVTTTKTVGGVDNSGARNALIASFVQGANPQLTAGTKAQGMETSDPLQFALAVRGLKDSPGRQVTTTRAASMAAPGGTASGSGAGAVDFAQQRIGHYAETSGSNRGAELDMLEKRFGMTGEAWCAMFATTAAAHGGASRAVRTPSVAQINQWASEGSHGYQRGLRPASHGRPGDLMTFGNHHVGVVASVDRARGTVTTIEGNTSSGKVQRVTRSVHEGRVVRPAYRS